MFKTWSEQEEKKLIGALQENQDLRDIAKRHERSVKAIEMRIELLIRRHHQNGKTIGELQKIFRKDEKTIESILNPKSTLDELSERVKRIEDTVNKIYKRQKQLMERLH